MKFNFFKGSRMRLPPVLKEFYKSFERNGFQAYLVGGAVRDYFLGKAAADYDVATDATPEQVMRLFKFVVPTGIAHGTVTVHFMRTEIEVTTFRTEGGYSDGRHPDKVEYAATIQDDLSRRDFTMNAIAVNLADGRIADPYGGRKDIRKRLIRTVGNAHERFMEDGLRPIRAIRFAGKLNFSIEKLTYSELFKKDIQEKTASISIERFRDEFLKILAADRPSEGLRLLEETGMLRLFIPELSECRGCIQSDYRAFHKFDVMDHLFYACDGAPSQKQNVRLAALFHDIGKPAAKRIKTQELLDGNKNDGTRTTVQTITFYNHETIGAEITERLMTRLKFPNDLIKNVCHLVREHMFHYESSWTDGAVRRFLVRVGKESLEDLFDLRLADMYGMHNEKVDVRCSGSVELLLELKERIRGILEEQNALSLKDLAVNGRILMEHGIPSGRQLGLILEELLSAVLEDPSLNTRERLIDIAEKIQGNMREAH